MRRLAPHSKLNTSTSSLSPASPVFLSSSSPNPDLLSAHPFIHCEDPLEDGTSTEFHSSTTHPNPHDDVKTFHHRPIRCLIVVHASFLAQRDTDLLAESAHLSCAKKKMHRRLIHLFSPDPYKDKRATLNKKQKNETSNSETFVTETNQIMWTLLTGTIPHGRTIMHMVTPATEASMTAVGHFSKYTILGRTDYSY